MDERGEAGAARPERIGVFGGTFDPPHDGHLAAAASCRAELDLDRVLLVVANHPWQKAGRRITPAADRLAMVEAMVAGAPGSGIQACSMEIERGGPSYTVDTVEELRDDAASGGHLAPQVFLVVGSDLVPTLMTWHRAVDLRRLVTLAVVSRPGSRPPAAPEGWRAVPVDGEAVDVSSSEIRQRLRQGRSVAGLVPVEVLRCIRRRGLYAVSR